MITWSDELAAIQRQQEMLNTALEEFNISQMLPQEDKKESIITRSLHGLGERLVIAGVRLQLLNPQLNSTTKGGKLTIPSN